MSPDQLFSILNLVALTSWVLLALFPGRRIVTDVMAGTAVPAALAAIYTVIIAFAWSSSSGGFSSLSAVAALFGNQWLLLAGWTHYLAFDLLIGGWEVRDARERGVPHLFVLPCLVVTFLFGPAGWLLYRGLRATYASNRGAVLARP
ncbi:MAG TPA: ABA4-like family protein [Vicinamibacterales bacterium]